MPKLSKKVFRGKRPATSIPVVVKEWSSVPGRIRSCIDDLKAEDLLIRGGAEGWSIAEYVHHLVEANLIASNVVLAALGKPGCIYDWSWVTPDRDWMIRLSYDRAPIEPALALHQSLTRHISSLLTLTPRSLRRHVAIVDTPGVVPRKSSVAKVLRDEITHATHHLADIEAAKRTTSGKK